MNTYDNEVLQQINQDVDLLDYVRSTGIIEMKKSGDDYFGRCPLHVDKTPSFSITPHKNLYYCFSCGKAGGIIRFLMDYEGLRFNDAVAKAAKLASFDLTKMCRSKTVAYLKKIKMLRMGLQNSVEHKVLSDIEIDKYQKEYPDEWIKEGIGKDVMDLFGIRVDIWHNRIVYPVYDIEGKLINVKGRTRYENYKEIGIPKYINYYPVGTMDYFQGLNITLPYIKESNEVIIFESIKSVMKAYAWGNKNCVSAEKHTLTREQVSFLVKLKVNVVFAYDSDVDYRKKDVRREIDKLKRVTNVFIIEDRGRLLGGRAAKNAPVDCGQDIWQRLYTSKKKVV